MRVLFQICLCLYDKYSYTEAIMEMLEYYYEYGQRVLRLLASIGWSMDQRNPASMVPERRTVFGL